MARQMKKRPRRTRLKMKIDILKAVASEPVNPSMLGGITNMNHSTLKRNLSNLEGCGFVEIEQIYGTQTEKPYMRLVHITVEGLKVLNEYESLVEKMGED